MAILERKNASEWTRDWFPPRVPSIKIDVVGRNVDVMDTFLLLYGGTQSSAASLQSKWFGEKTIDAAMKTVSLLPSEACRVVWTLPSGDVKRRIVPLDGMVRILNKLGTPTAVKLAVDMESALGELTQGGAIVVSGASQTKQTSTLEAAAPMVATTTAPPNTMIPFTPQFPVVDPSIMQVNKFNSSATAIKELTERSKEQQKLYGVQSATFEMQHNTVIAAEIAQAEKTAKKKKIEDESHQASKNAALAAEIAQVEHAAKKQKIQDESEHESQQASKNAALAAEIAQVEHAAKKKKIEEDSDHESELAKIKMIGICDAELDRQLKELIKLYKTDNSQEMLQQLNDLVKQRLENTKERLLGTTPTTPTT